MTRAELSRRIREQWEAIVARSGCHLDAFDALPNGPLRILGSSTKIRKGESRGILSAVAYLAPAESSGRNLCPRSTPACRAGCLGENSGRMVMRPAKRARLWKTALRFGSPDLYRALVRLDIAELERKAKQLGMLPAVRLDGTSDLGDGARLAPEFPGVTFYDYTKRPEHARKVAARGMPNYSATLSFSEVNRRECIAHLRRGGNVAVPFAIGRGEPLPNGLGGFRVIDGDESDYRPADPIGVVVGLRWKGPKRTRDAAERSGWAQPVA